MKNTEFVMGSVFLFALIISAHVRINTPIDDLSISLQTIVVGIICFVFSTRNALIILLVYSGLGLLGLNVFSAIHPGLTMHKDPYFGFLIGFLMVPLYLVWVKSKFNQTQLLNLFFVYVGMHVVIVSLGLIRMEYPNYSWTSMKIVLISLLPAAVIKSAILAVLDFVYQKRQAFSSKAKK